MKRIPLFHWLPIGIMIALTGCRSPSPDSPQTALRSEEIPGGELEEMKVKSFVRQTYLHGVPYESARQLGSDAVPVLLAMLADPREEAHWANVAVTLAILGDERAQRPLVEFIEADPQSTISPQHYAAKTAALMAMGYYLNQTEDHNCYEYLSERSRPEHWDSKNISWNLSTQTSEEQHQEMATMALLGLALSGTADAEENLRSRQEARQRNSVQDASEGALLQEAIKACQEIRSEGLRSYYQKSQKQPASPPN